MFKKDFIFSVARVRVLESRLLNPSQIERMVSASDATEAFKILNDLDWAQFLGEAKRPEDFQEVLENGLLEAKSLITEAPDYTDEFNFLWIFFDMHNAKVLFKALIKGEREDEVRSLLSPLGSVSRGTMARIALDGEEQENFEFLLPLREEILKDYQENANPESVELMVEKAFFERINPLVKATRSSMIRNFFRTMIDIRNILAYLKRFNFEAEEKEMPYFVVGGRIKKELFLQSTSVDEFFANPECERYKETVYSELTNGKIGSYAALERKFDDMLFEKLKPSRFEAIGPEALFAYFWLKRRNAEIIRAIMVGKLNGVAEKQIRAWLKNSVLSLF